jgi:hypothetical protein
VVIRYFHVEGIATPPHEAHTVSIVDPNAVLVGSIVTPRFEPVAGRSSQILQTAGRVKHRQFLPGGTSQIRWGHSLTPARVPEFLRALVSEGLNHFSYFNGYR